MDPLQPGDPRRIGPYRLQARLGAGGMGQVFLALSPGGGRKVAVKLIRPDYARNPQFRERFALEVQAARRVGGFHTAQVIDAAPDAEAPWMVTAYISGPSLQDLVHGGTLLAPQTVSELGAGLSEGLGAIHACGLVHRDLKPGNVIMADDGPRIIDFGIAQVGNASALTVTGAPIGTYAFMSPEQVRGEEVGPASDVFSLGCVLAFAANGHGPFDAPNIPAIVRRILDEPPRLDGLADPLRELIAACLAKEPAHRPEIAEILRRTGPSPHIRTEPGATPKPTEPLARPEPLLLPESRKSGLRRDPGRRAILLGGVAAAAVAVPAVVFWLRDKKDPGQQSGAGKAPEKAGPNRPTAGELNGKVPVVGAAYSPDGGTIAASSYRASKGDGAGDKGDSGCIQLWDTATRRLSTLTLGESDFLPNAVAFSPNGKTLAVGSAGSDSVTLWNMATGRVRTTLKREWDFDDDSWSWTNALAFSPDGKTLAVSGQDYNTGGEGQIRLWDLSGRRPVGTALDGRHEGAFFHVAFSPDGRSIAAGGESGVRLWDRSNHRVTALRDTVTYTNAVAFSPDSKTLASCDGSSYEASASTGRGGIWLWDATTGRTTTLTEEIVYSVAFRPDGKSLASAGKDGLKVWNVATGRVSVLDDSAHYWLALSPDGAILATTSKSPTTEIQLWNLT